MIKLSYSGRIGWIHPNGGSLLLVGFGFARCKTDGLKVGDNVVCSLKQWRKNDKTYFFANDLEVFHA